MAIKDKASPPATAFFSITTIIYYTFTFNTTPTLKSPSDATSYLHIKQGLLAISRKVQVKWQTNAPPTAPPPPTPTSAKPGIAKNTPAAPPTPKPKTKPNPKRATRQNLPVKNGTPLSTTALWRRHLPAYRGWMLLVWWVKPPWCPLGQQ